MDNENEFGFENIFEESDFDVGDDVAPEDVPLFALANAMQREIDRPKTLIMNPVQLQKMNQMQKAIKKYMERAKEYPLNDNIMFKLLPYANQHDIELVLILDDFVDFKDLMQTAFSLDIEVRIGVSDNECVRVGFTIKDLYVEVANQS